MKPLRSLILVANDEMARFFLNEGVGKGLDERFGLSSGQFQVETVDHEDRPGRSAAGPGGMARHAFGRHQSDDELERERFAQHVAECLDREWQTLSPDRLFIAAGPKMLGALRKRIGKAPAAALAGELAKDLVKVPHAELPSHFSDLLAL